jgi:hypothetical protein
MSRPFFAASAVLVALAVAPNGVAEQVESPLYASWARHKVGTAVTLRSVTEAGAGAGKAETTTTYRLVELDDKKAVVEMVVVSNATGKEVKNAPQRLEIRRLFPLLPGVKKEDVGKPSGAIAKGEETISVAGKEYKAQWYDSKGRTEAGESIARTWISDEVPGTMLKSIIRVPKAKATTTMELVEIKTP